MRTRRPIDEHGGDVNGPETDRVTVEFEPGEPIQGRMLGADGSEQRFRGWLELCAALDREWRQREYSGCQECAP
jgi:hypothetical protein